MWGGNSNSWFSGREITPYTELVYIIVVTNKIDAWFRSTCGIDEIMVPLWLRRDYGIWSIILVSLKKPRTNGNNSLIWHVSLSFEINYLWNWYIFSMTIIQIEQEWQDDLYTIGDKTRHGYFDSKFKTKKVPKNTQINHLKIVLKWRNKHINTRLVVNVVNLKKKVIEVLACQTNRDESTEDGQKVNQIQYERWKYS